jgi:hypothetical protein
LCLFCAVGAERGSAGDGYAVQNLVTGGNTVATRLLN